MLGQVVEQVAREQRRIDLGGRREVTDAVALVHTRAAQRSGVDLLAGHLGHDGRARQEHRRALAHDHEVGQRRAVGGSPGRRSADDRNLRDQARQADVL